MKRVAIVTCKERLNKVIDDQLIREKLEKNKVKADIVAWDNKKINWLEYDVIFIRSVWNSCLKYREYIEFLIYLKNMNKKVINDIDDIINNLWKNKSNKDIVYINHDLKKFKVEVKKITNNKKINSLVLKPIIGESSYHVYRYNKNSIKAKNSKGLDYIIKKIYKDNKRYGNPGIIIENFINEITYGEYCIYYFNSKIIYAIKKYPSRFQNRKDIEIVNIIPSKILKYINDNELIKSGYGRIDLINGEKIYLMEIEKNDPDLYLRKLNNDTLAKVLEEIYILLMGENNEQ